MTTMCFSWSTIPVQTSVKGNLWSQSAGNQPFFLLLFLGVTVSSIKLQQVWERPLKSWIFSEPLLNPWITKTGADANERWLNREAFFVLCATLLTRHVCPRVVRSGIHVTCQMLEWLDRSILHYRSAKPYLSVYNLHKVSYFLLAYKIIICDWRRIFYLLG